MENELILAGLTDFARVCAVHAFGEGKARVWVYTVAGEEVGATRKAKEAAKWVARLEAAIKDYAEIVANAPAAAVVEVPADTQTAFAF